MTTTAAHMSGKAEIQSRWKTIRIPPYRERDGLVDEGMRYMREKKFSPDQQVILICSLDYGLSTRAIGDPQSDVDLDMDKAVPVDTDELREHLYDRLKMPRQELMRNLDAFVELGFFQGLESRKTS